MILGSGIQEGLLLKPVTYSWAYDLYNHNNLSSSAARWLKALYAAITI